MSTSIASLLQSFATGLGRCSKCMRKALAACLISWALLPLISIFFSGAWSLFAVVALAFTALWLSHVVMWSRRYWLTSSEFPTVPDRRMAFSAIVRTAAVGIAFSAFPLLWPTTASAFCGQCSEGNDDACGVGYSCKDTSVNGSPCWECVKD